MERGLRGGQGNRVKSTDGVGFHQILDLMFFKSGDKVMDE